MYVPGLGRIDVGGGSFVSRSTCDERGGCSMSFLIAKSLCFTLSVYISVVWPAHLCHLLLWSCMLVRVFVDAVHVNHSDRENGHGRAKPEFLEIEFVHTYAAIGGILSRTLKLTRILFVFHNDYLTAPWE